MLTGWLNVLAEKELSNARLAIYFQFYRILLLLSNIIWVDKESLILSIFSCINYLLLLALSHHVCKFLRKNLISPNRLVWKFGVNFSWCRAKYFTKHHQHSLSGLILQMRGYLCLRRQFVCFYQLLNYYFSANNSICLLLMRNQLYRCSNIKQTYWRFENSVLE